MHVHTFFISECISTQVNSGSFDRFLTLTKREDSDSDEPCLVVLYYPNAAFFLKRLPERYHGIRVLHILFL